MCRCSKLRWGQAGQEINFFFLLNCDVKFHLFLQIVLPSEAPGKVRKSPCCDKFLKSGATDDWGSETEESRISPLSVSNIYYTNYKWLWSRRNGLYFFQPVNNLWLSFLWSLCSFISFRDPSLKFPFWCLHSSLFAASFEMMQESQKNCQRMIYFQWSRSKTFS